MRFLATLTAALVLLAACGQKDPGGTDQALPGTVGGASEAAASEDPRPAGVVELATAGQGLDPIGPFDTAQLTLAAPSGGTTQTLRIYDAADAPARQQGLMGVESLPDDVGMLFRFTADNSGGFWMKNTLIPLSIAFADADGKILKILDMKPCKADPCRVYEPGVSYRYALEVNRGAFQQLGVTEGWTMQLPDGLRDPR